MGVVVFLLYGVSIAAVIYVGLVIVAFVLNLPIAIGKEIISTLLNRNTKKRGEWPNEPFNDHRGL